MDNESDGVVYEQLRDMWAARRARYMKHLEVAVNFTQTAHAVGVSKRTGNVWRNGVFCQISVSFEVVQESWTFWWGKESADGEVHEGTKASCG